MKSRKSGYVTSHVLDKDKEKALDIVKRMEVLDIQHDELQAFILNSGKHFLHYGIFMNTVRKEFKSVQRKIKNLSNIAKKLNIYEF